MTTPPRLLVDLVSDPVCPWCYVGLKSYFKAKQALDQEFQLVTRLRPYQLNPDTPLEGADREAYYAKKFPDPAFRNEMRARLVQAAESAGFIFDPSIPKKLPNTLAAHRVLRWAHYQGLHEILAAKLYAAFWDDGADIGDAETLARLASEAGLDAEEVKEKLKNNADAETVTEEAHGFRAAGVNGVPTYIVDERTGFSGALPPQQLEAAIRRAAVHDAAGN